MKNRSLAQILRSLPIIQTVLDRTEFPVSATVETSLSIYEAGFSYATSNQPQARWHRSISVESGRVLWLFEVEEDAVLFACKFGGEIRGPVPVGLWPRSKRPWQGY
jgi:hypothetical protein